MDIKEFLINHPFISAHSLERALNIPKGTIRPTASRAIPNKYKADIINLLKDYGWQNDDMIKEKERIKQAINDLLLLI